MSSDTARAPLLVTRIVGRGTATLADSCDSGVRLLGAWSVTGASVTYRFGTRICARAPLAKRSSATTSSFRCSPSSANGLRPAPIAIGTGFSLYSSMRPRRVSDLAKPGPPWTRIVPSSSRAFRSAISEARSPPKISTGPHSAFQGVGEDGLRLLVHRGCDRPLGRGPVRAHDLVAAAAHRMNAGLLEGAAVPLTRVIAEPLEHPFMGPVGAGDKTVERHDHLENHFSIAHGGRDRPDRVNSSLIGGFELRGGRSIFASLCRGAARHRTELMPVRAAPASARRCSLRHRAASGGEAMARRALRRFAASRVCPPRCRSRRRVGGRYWARTSDLRLVEAALSQLS